MLVFIKKYYVALRKVNKKVYIVLLPHVFAAGSGTCTFWLCNVSKELLSLQRLSGACVAGAFLLSAFTKLYQLNDNEKMARGR